MTLAVRQTGAFVQAAAGYRFRLVSEPAEREPCGTIVFVHAFAEEMNKSRRMAARMARMFAADGWRVVQRDLCGCGDSSGEFGDATWEAWIYDVRAEFASPELIGPVWFWSLRAGALLASSVLADQPHTNLLLWQPVASGAQHLQQFLRLQAGARIVGSAKADDSQSPAQLLRAGATVEVGGYDINPALAAGLQKAALAVPEAFSGRIVWLEVSPDDAPELSPQAQRLIEPLRARGVSVEAQALNGPPFWQTQEIEECEALLDHTLATIRHEEIVGEQMLGANT